MADPANPHAACAFDDRGSAYWVRLALGGGTKIMPSRRCALLAGFYAAREGLGRDACPFGEVDLAVQWQNGHKTAPRHPRARVTVRQPAAAAHDHGGDAFPWPIDEGGRG